MRRGPDGERLSYRAKTKSGCLTCKCSSTGRKCDGYEAPSPQSRLRLPSYKIPVFRCSENGREIRSFQYFYERTVSSLAGYGGSEFWNRLVLQVSQHEKPIWHALVALGALHENFESHHHSTAFELLQNGQDNFAIQEYVIAIRALLSPSNPSSPDTCTRASAETTSNITVDVCLISCILFVCFETLSGHYVSAINHARSGMRILGEVRYDSSSGTYRHTSLKPSTVTMLEMETLHKMFIRLQVQISVLTRADTDHPTIDIIEKEQPYNIQIEVPERFNSLVEARDFLEHNSRLCSAIHAKAIKSVPPDQVQGISTYLTQQYASVFNKWRAALDFFEESRGTFLTAKERVGLKILRIHQYSLVLLLAKGRSGGCEDSFDWDEYNHVFAEILSLSASVAQVTLDNESASDLPHMPRDENGPKPTFTLDNCIIGPLYNVATLCRDPTIRRKAVHVLRLARRQEGIYNSQVTAMAAEKVIAIEEASAAKLGLDDCEDVSSLTTIVAETRNEDSHSIGKSADVPQSVRLTYAYPKFDTTNRKIFLTIGQDMGNTKMHLNLPFPAATTLMDAEFASLS
ncbi:hypothetical protein PISL3812_08054 [Talaromyces islandicus]|uniref:Zn(2)-C6 fungal-type domain-containing protein n=1 Tax=Talaromyces islandicus TaxID=28573 RepID=A0A0U1M7V7_TALIS|nr:hypothetical protein PISL3812_08054 [Talaromyces islandicus]